MTAPMQIAMPSPIFKVIGSPNIMVPMIIAVSGSKTPRMEVLVGPIKRDETASVNNEIMVGKTARPTRLPQSAAVSIPSMMLPPWKMRIMANRIVPVISA